MKFLKLTLVVFNLKTKAAPIIATVEDLTLKFINFLIKPMSDIFIHYK